MCAKALTRQLSTRIKGIKRPKKAKLYIYLFSILALAGAFSFSVAYSSLYSSITIQNSGNISIGVTAASGSAVDIQAAVNLAASNGGGNVYIPAGIFNWASSAQEWLEVQVPEGVSIFGAVPQLDGNGQVLSYRTIIQIPFEPGGWGGGVTDPSPLMFRFTGANGAHGRSRFSYIEFDGYRTFNTSSKSEQLSIAATNMAGFRIDHCFFHNIAGGISLSKCRAVIDHCRMINDVGIPGPNTYTDETVGYGVAVFGDSTWDDNIYNVVGHFTKNTVVIEDCYFSLWRHCVASNDGSHYVFRHNIINGDTGFGSLDAHGTYNIVGSRATEVYDNYFGNVTGYYGQAVMFWRGGGGVFYNNVFTATASGFLPYLSLQIVNEGSVEKCFPHDMYLWNNTNMVNVAVLSGGITENEDYFLYAMPNFAPLVYPFPLDENGLPSAIP